MKEIKILKNKIQNCEDAIFDLKQRSFDEEEERKDLIKELNESPGDDDLRDRISKVSKDLKMTLNTIKREENKLINYAEKLELHEKFNR